MKKSPLTLEEAQKLHSEGQLEEAKESYLTLLEDNPQNAELLHLLGLLSAEMGDLNEALHYLEEANRILPHHPTLTLHYANILKAKGDLPKAEEVLLQMTKDHSQFAAGFNNLGTVYFAEQKWQQALQAFETAISLQANYIDAYYNLGLALNKLHRFEAAQSAFQAVIEMSPTHPGAAFQLGCLDMQQGLYEKAWQHFSIIEKAHPFHFETQVNLATSALKLGRLLDAKSHYLKALEITPDDNQVLFNLGVIEVQLGKLDDAVSYYKNAIKNDADFYDAHYNLGFIYLIKRDANAATLHFREAQRIRPDDKALKHTIDILAHKKDISQSPPEYVRSLFDSYADHFEPHLKQFLHYQVPQVFLEAMKTVQKEETPIWDILDIGCGTGLTGQAFKPFARSLVGVDLSRKMLDVAAEKHIYDQLFEEDIITFLNDKYDCYDLILAGDVMVYYGDLTQLFASVNKALHAQGFFLFNTEINSDEDYTLSESGRFAHSKAYLDKLALQNHFQVIIYKVATMRTQNYQPVLGHLYLLRKELS